MNNGFYQIHNNGETIRPSSSNSVIVKPERRSESSDLEADDAPSNVILKIPSFKPTTSKNGNDPYRNPSESTSVVSPPITNTSESNSPPILPGRGTLQILQSHEFIVRRRQNSVLCVRGILVSRICSVFQV